MKKVSTLTLICEGEIFLIQRSKEVDHSEKWASPGGAIDPEEEPSHAALREFREETQFDLASIGILPESLNSAPSYSSDEVEAHFFYAKITPEQKAAIKVTLNFENLQAGWYQINNLPKTEDIHQHFVTPLNYMIKWEIDKDAIPIGRRPGLDIAIAGSEQDNREISKLATDVYIDHLVGRVNRYKYIEAKVSAINELIEKLKECEAREQKEIDDYKSDLDKVKANYDVIANLRVRDNEKNLAELMFPLENQDDEFIPGKVSYYGAQYQLKSGDKYDTLKLEGNGRFNIFKGFTGLKDRMANAVTAIQAIEQMASQYQVTSRDIVKATLTELSENKLAHIIVRKLPDIKSRYKEERRQLIKEAESQLKESTKNFIPEYFKSDRLSYDTDSSAEMSEKLSKTKKELEEKSFKLNYKDSRLSRITEAGLLYMNPEARKVLLEAVNNSGFKLATNEERQKAIEEILRHTYRESPLVHELGMLPKPQDGKTYVYHSSSHLFNMPSEEYIARPTTHGPKGRGSQFDGIGFYTTVSTERAASYEGGSSDNKNSTKLVNGYQIYVYEIDLNPDNILKDGASNLEQNKRVDEVLSKRGTSLEKLCEKHEIVRDKWFNPNAFGLNDNFCNNPLFCEYGAAGTIEILKEVGLTCATANNQNTSPSDRIVFNIPALKPIARIEKAPAAPVKEALATLRPHLKDSIDLLEPHEIAYEYIITARAYNHDVLTNYHISNLMECLDKDFGLRNERAEVVVNQAIEKAKERDETITVDNVYFENNKPPKYTAKNLDSKASFTERLNSQNSSPELAI